MLLAISACLLILVSVPSTEVSAEALMPTNCTEPEAETTYAVHQSGNEKLPQGIQSLRDLGQVVIGETSVRWAGLSTADRAQSIRDMAGRLGRKRDLLIFTPSGRLAGRFRCGVTEVYP